METDDDMGDDVKAPSNKGRKMARTTMLYCHERTGRIGDPTFKFFFDFYPRVELVRMCEGHREEDRPPIYRVRVSEAAESEGCYWAWWDNEDRAFTLVFPHKGLVEVCFPYGTKGEVERGRGFLLPVTVGKTRLMRRLKGRTGRA